MGDTKWCLRETKHLTEPCPLGALPNNVMGGLHWGTLPSRLRLFFEKQEHEVVLHDINQGGCQLWGGQAAGGNLRPLT